MRKRLILMQAVFVFVCALVHGRDAEQGKSELSALSINELRQISWSNLQLYGCYVGLPVSELKGREKQFDIIGKSLTSDSVSFFPFHAKEKDEISGVTAFFNEGRIAWLRLGATTAMHEPGTPQCSYIKKMNPELRSFFENYSDPLRLEILGEGKKLIDVSNSRFHDYVYDYRSKGIALRVQSFAQYNWREELRFLYIYNPNGQIPPDIKRLNEKK